MKQEVDLGRILDLAGDMKRLNQTIENGTTTMFREMSTMLEAVKHQYPEGYVQAEVHRTQQDLQEIMALAMSISHQLDQKTGTLTQTAYQYQYTEQQLLKKIGLFQRNHQLPSRLFGGNPSNLSKEKNSDLLSFVERLNRYFHSAKKGQLITWMKPFQDDPKISTWLQQLQQGTLEEQEEAEQYLRVVRWALQDVARCQVAYDVYAHYGNKVYMAGAHGEAEKIRASIRVLGLSESLVNAPLGHYYSGSSLDACEYDPRLSDGTIMPTARWKPSDSKLSEDKQVAILLLSDQYFKASTKAQREELMRLANRIRDGSLNPYMLLGPTIDATTVSGIIQSILNDENVFPEMHQEVLQDNKWSLFVHQDGMYEEEAIQAVMKTLQTALNEADVEYRAWAMENHDLTFIHKQTEENSPPMILPDGTAITVDNSRNETTFEYFLKYIMKDPNNVDILRNPDLEYQAWLNETYGKKENHVIEAIDGIGLGIFEGVIGLVEGVVEAVKHPIDTILAVGLMTGNSPQAKEFQHKVIINTSAEIAIAYNRDVSNGGPSPDLNFSRVVHLKLHQL